MKRFTLIPLIVIFFGCNNAGRGTHEANDTTENPNSLSDTLQINLPDVDSVNIGTVSTDTICLKRTELLDVLKYNPEFKKEYLDEPDICYATRTYSNEANDAGYNFGGEAGQDSYYIYYAYFLKLRNGNNNQPKRAKLVEIFRKTNEIFGKLEGGGTYFSHMNARILAYAEYAIDTYADGSEPKPYDITRQKKLYTEAFKQYITDEIQKSDIPYYKDKDLLRKELFETVDHIGGLITDEFYLKQAHKFHYARY